jgi:spermidine synthase
MTDTVTEISEADASTTYTLERRIYQGRTTVGTDVIIGDSPVYGRMLFLDGELQSASSDEHVYHEALVHSAMLMAAPETGGRVLVVGGGEGATVREVLKWPTATIDWVDYDGDLVRLCESHLQWAPFVLEHPRVTFMAADIRDALPRLAPQYDVVILDLPDPDGETGWLYSAEFWTAMKGLVAPTGRLVTHCGPVRPFGNIGEGFMRVQRVLGEARVSRLSGFYSVPIASFQGEWGFWMWAPGGAEPFGELTKYGSQRAWWIPAPLRVAKLEQIRAWAACMPVWHGALAGLA